MVSKNEKQKKFEEKLVIQVEKYPILYDANLKDFKDRAKKMAVWQKIAEATEIDAESANECITRFRYLRQEYSRLKKASTTESGLIVSKRKLERNGAFQRMKFLDKHIVTRKSKEDNEEEKTKNESSCQTNKSNFREEVISKKRKLESLLSVCEDMIISNNEKDDCSHFATYLSHTLRSLPMQTRQLAILKIQDVLYQVICTSSQQAQTIHPTSMTPHNIAVNMRPASNYQVENNNMESLITLDNQNPLSSSNSQLTLTQSDHNPSVSRELKFENV